MRPSNDLMRVMCVVGAPRGHYRGGIGVLLEGSITWVCRYKNPINAIERED